MPVNPKIATIKIAVKQLGMDDATYRAMLTSLTGKNSATLLNYFEQSKVIDHLVKCGAVVKKSTKRRGAPSTLDRNEQYAKIEALLADMKLPWSYADKVAENITGGRSGGIPRLGWVKSPVHLQKIIAALSYEHEKRCLLQQVDDMLANRHKTRADVEARIAPAYQATWTRNKKLLQSLLKSIPEWWNVQGKGQTPQAAVPLDPPVGREGD